MRTIPDAWADLWVRVVGDSYEPSNDELAAAVRECSDIPAELAELVAGRLDGSKPRSAHRPRSLERESQRWWDARLRWLDMRWIQAAFRLQSRDVRVQAGARLGAASVGPMDVALAVVAKKNGIAPETLRRALRDAPPRAIPDVDLKAFTNALEGRISAAIEQGRAELDPEVGLVWLQSDEEE